MTYTDTLASNGIITANFVAPANVTNFLLVFRGTIGVSNRTALWTRQREGSAARLNLTAAVSKPIIEITQLAGWH